MKTAMQLAIEEIKTKEAEAGNSWLKAGFTLTIDILRRLEHNEKQQIIDAFAEGHARFTECEESELEEKAETYYNQTYNQ